jgi:hypothetical protein
LAKGSTRRRSRERGVVISVAAAEAAGFPETHERAPLELKGKTDAIDVVRSRIAPVQ